MEAVGGRGEQVTEPEQLGGALERALSGEGPVVVNVMTDPENVYPRSSVLA
jgi:acetolactate synthase-1/2/3 large subunit